MFDFGIDRSGGQIVFEIFNRFFVAFGKYFDSSIIHIFHITANLMAGGGLSVVPAQLIFMGLGFIGIRAKLEKMDTF